MRSDEMSAGFGRKKRISPGRVLLISIWHGQVQAAHSWLEGGGGAGMRTDVCSAGGNAAGPCRLQKQGVNKQGTGKIPGQWGEQPLAGRSWHERSRQAAVQNLRRC